MTITKTTIKIRDREGEVLWTTEVRAEPQPLRTALEEAVRAGADLWGAELSGADLWGASLEGAFLRGAYLRGANLSRASLSGAVLRGADLEGAVLTSANLARASAARAVLTGAVLTDACLWGADLEGAHLEDADLSAIRADVERVLALAPAEVPALLAALRAGAAPLPRNASSPAERWFLAIARGDTPARSQVAAITETWIDSWLAAHGEPRKEQQP